ncbi:MAG: hypothetical protein U0797_15310 [Gemmataceae bacterium]
MPPGLAVGQKVACARCGEAFTLTRLPDDVPADPSPATAPPTPVAKPVRANRLVALGVLAVMALMAGVGLTYALLTVQTRRDHDRALPRKSRRPWQTERTEPPDQVPAPGDLAGLGYLPATTGVVAAVQVEELLASPAGRELRSRPFKIGQGDYQLDNLKDWVGVAVEEIEHVVLGVTVRDGHDADLTPPTQLVVRTSQPYDARRVQVALKASKAREGRADDGTKRTLYTASVRGVPATLWLADERTFVVGLFGQFDLVPGKPHDGLKPLRTDLREVVEKRIPVGAPVWVAGHADDWKKTWLPTLAAAAKDVPLTARLGEVKTFALWLAPSKPAKVTGAFRCADEAVARKIEAAELTPRAKDDVLKYSRDGAWLDVQVTLSQARP